MIAMFLRSSLVAIRFRRVGDGSRRDPVPARRSPPCGGLRGLLESGARLGSLLDARGGRALGAFFGLVAHFGALGQGLEALSEDGAVMYEDVLGAVVGRDEPVALIVAKPLDCSSRHALPPHCCAANAEDAVKQLRGR